MNHTPIKKNILTKKELSVLKLLSEGFTSKNIAVKLKVTCRTVEFHTARIYKKLGAKNKIQALNAAYQNGITLGTVTPFETSAVRIARHGVKR